MRKHHALILIAVAVLTAPATALAEFPYPAPSGNPSDYTQYKIPSGADKAPNEIAGGLAFKFAATPEPGNEPTNSNPYELNGVRGPSTADQADVDQAWRTSTGRPDVTIATLDSGIKWNDRGAMSDLRKKTRISKGEAPEPQTGRAVALEDGVNCATFDGAGYDKNEDGVFNVVDYACDPRVERDPAKRKEAGKPEGVGPADMLDPQDVLIAFTDGDDDDSNGFKDDMVGWDFLDDDNDPYDDVQYGHGTGEAEDGFGEANNGGAVSQCPNCMGIHMRVGDSFIADVNNFAEAVVYATDNDVEVVQEALGTLNHSKFGLDAVEYAYDHGVTIIASAADEAAQHHNWPSSYPHVVMVNSVTKYNSTTNPAPPPATGRSYLAFNGCTNFMANVTLAIPSTSCSSDAVGQSAGMAGLMYSAALNAHERGENPLRNHATCRRTNGRPCVISANEVRQLMASGTVEGTQQADDVDFLSSPKGGAEPSCNPPVLYCNDPNNPGKVSLITAHRPIQPFVPPNTRSYTARKGHDQFYGYGRVNMNRAVDSLDAKLIPPEVEIRKPVEWWNQIDPSKPTFPLEAQISSRAPTYTCEVFIAPGSYPNNDTGSAGDFKKVQSSWCDGKTARGVPLNGKVADVSIDQLKSLFPANAQGFNDREPGKGTEQTSNGRPNTEPYGFVVKIVATAKVGDKTLTGQDRRNDYLHRDQDQLDRFPKKLPTDGAASPLFVDLDGDNRNELVVATSDGDVHAYRRDGSELAGWPVKSDALPIHDDPRPGRRRFGPRGAILASPAAADLDGDGTPEVVAADLEGKLYAWNAAGRRVFQRETEIRFSGKPLAPFADVRRGKKYRTQHGILASPVLADLDRDDGGKLEVVVAGMDRHVYAWNHDGSPVDGYPVLVADYSKLQDRRADETTHALNFKPDVGDLNQGAIINTPAVGDLDGDPNDEGPDEKPEIVVGTNEEYEPGKAGEPPVDFNQTQSYSVAAALLDPVNSRMYALKPEGDDNGPNEGPAPYVHGWPTPIAFLLAEILPVVGEGITGSPVISMVNCPPGGEGPKVGAISAAGPAYVLNEDGSSCYGKEGGRKRTTATDTSSSTRVTDKPSIPAFGQPVFGDMGDGTSLFVPSAGLIRALDVAANEYQLGGQDQLSGFNAQTGAFRANYPVQMNDLQFLSGPAVADIDGLPGQEIVNGSASLDLQAYDLAGLPVNAKWPKLTSDWMVSTPLIGSFGDLETDSGAKKTIVAVTRSGLIHAYRTEAGACTGGSWPKFHHDNANSGDYRRDAVAPGKPGRAAFVDNGFNFAAPGDDLLCGTAERYELVHSDRPISGSTFDEAEPLSGAPAPAKAGTAQRVALAAGVKRYVALRAGDEQGNVGRAIVVDRRAPGGGLPGGGGGGGVGGAPGASGVAGPPRPPCLPRRLGATTRRIGPARLGMRLSALTRRYRVLRRSPRSGTRFCVNGGGRFVVSTRRGRIDAVGSTARGHRAGRTRVGARVRGGRRLGRGLVVARRRSSGRLVYALRGRRVRSISVVSRRYVSRPRALRRRLGALGLLGR
jgi:hypothetical protein